MNFNTLFFLCTKCKWHRERVIVSNFTSEFQSFIKWKWTTAMMHNPFVILKKGEERNSAEIALQILSHFSWLNYEDKLHSIFCKSKASLNKMEEIHSHNTVFGAVLSI